MAFEPKAGSFALFKNDKGGVETRADYKGDGCDLNGNPVWVSAWLKEGKSGKFLSCSMQPKDKQAPAKSSKQDSSTGDDIPF